MHLSHVLPCCTFQLEEQNGGRLENLMQETSWNFWRIFCSRSLTALADLIPGRAASVEAGKLMMNLKLNVESTLIKKQIHPKMKFQQASTLHWLGNSRLTDYLIETTIFDKSVYCFIYKYSCYYWSPNQCFMSWGSMWGKLFFSTSRTKQLK